MYLALLEVTLLLLQNRHCYYYRIDVVIIESNRRTDIEKCYLYRLLVTQSAVNEYVNILVYPHIERTRIYYYNEKSLYLFLDE